MNWTCLVYGAPMLFVIIWWLVDAHKWFKGPKVNIQHRMLGQGELLEARHGASDVSLGMTGLPAANSEKKAPLEQS